MDTSTENVCLVQNAANQPSKYSCIKLSYIYAELKLEIIVQELKKRKPENYVHSEPVRIMNQISLHLPGRFE